MLKKKRNRILLAFQRFWYRIAVTENDKVEGLEEISLLFQSGMDTGSALIATAQDANSLASRFLFSDIRDSVISGLSLGEAMRRSKVFDELSISLIESGETSGSLEKNTDYLVSLKYRKREFSSNLRGAMLYPGLVFTIAIFVGVGVTWFILPRLTEVFSQLNVDLPLLTRLMIDLGSFMNENGLVLVVGGGLSLLLFFIIFFIWPLSIMGQWFLLRMPVIGALIRNVEMARMGFIGSTLLNAGIHIVEVFEVLSRSTKFKSYKKLYLLIASNLEKGSTLRLYFENNRIRSNYLDSTVRQILIAGESSGSFPTSFERISEHYSAKMNRTMKNVSVLMEPVLLFVVWLGVVFVALAVILPIYELTGNVRQQTQSDSPAPISDGTQIIESSENPNTDNPANVEEEVQSNATSTDYLVIKETGVGYLNVRFLPSTNSEIVGVSYPGETYNILSEEQGWFEIKIDDSQSGWVYGEYVEVNYEELFE